jgi:uncharacterized protein YhbP (UPF0306 family)
MSPDSIWWDTARSILDENDYITLATADAAGRPWVSPVWYAHDTYRRYLWVSRPETRHSRNLDVRGEIGIVVFDSTVAPFEGQAVYIEANASRVKDDDLDRLLDVYARRADSRGAGEWSLADITAPAGLRLYEAIATQTYVLDEHDERIPVDVDP